MRILLLIALFFCATLLATVHVDENLTHVDSIKQQIIVKDEHKKLTPQDMLDKNFSKTCTKLNTGYSQSAFWSVFELQNISKREATIVLRNQKAGIDKVDAYIFDENKKLLQTHILGDTRDQSLRILSSTNSAFYLTLASGEKVSVVTRFESLGPMYLAWDIHSAKDYAKLNSWNLLFFGLFGGIVFALVIYNINMFLSLKEISFVWYILHALSIAWFQFAFSGVFYFMNLGIDLYFLTLSTWLAPSLVLIFFILFITNIFRLYEKKRKLFIYFMTIGAVNLCLTALFVIPQTAGWMFTHQYLLHITWSLTMLSIFVFLIYAYWRGFSYAGYFLAGEGTYAFITISLLFISMKTDALRGIEFYILPMAMLWEIVFSSLALSKRVGEIKQNNELKDRLIAEEAKFSSVGRSIGNITHQWKEPLTRLSAHIVYMQALYYSGNEKKLLNEFGDNIEKSAQMIEYMKNSIDELYYFYSGERVGAINVKKTIDLAYKLQQDRLIPGNIAVEIECDENILMQGGKHALANTLMILFDNSVHQLISAGTKEPKIKIKAAGDESGVTIYFEDNGGGIHVTPIERIFDISYSTKADKGSGLGLSLAKKLIEEQLKGSLFVSNIQSGVLFRIYIPKLV